MGENKCLDQGTVLLHRREDEAGGNILHFLLLLSLFKPHELLCLLDPV